MNKKMFCLMMLVYTLLSISVYAEIQNQKNKSVNEALEYAQLPPLQRSRDKAVKMLFEALKATEDPSLKGDIYLWIARLYSQSYNQLNEKPEKHKAIDAYNNAINSFGDEAEIKNISAKIELCGVLTEIGRDVDAFPILESIIKLKPNVVYAAELNPSRLEKLSVLHPREIAGGVTFESETHKKIAADRINRAKANILRSFESKRESAVRMLCTIVYRKNGLRGLKNQVESFNGDPLCERVSKEILFDYMKCN